MTNCSYNTATGYQALFSDSDGGGNTANGALALLDNTTGGGNTANGLNALFSNTTGSGNTANGASALYTNSTGSNNTANGPGALQFSTGNYNAALGYKAGQNLAAGDNNLYIGNEGVATESNTIHIGTVTPSTDFTPHMATYVAGISGATVPGGTNVIIDASGHLGTTTSSARFKEEIKPMENASEAILALKPVTFRYKHELDPNGIPQFGLVAEEVEKVNPDLVARDAQGKVYTVRYEAVNAMLLNEFLKEHRTVEELKATVGKQEGTITQLKAAALKQEEVNAEQRKGIEALTESLKKQESQIQKVSAQLELSKPAPRTVDNSQ